MAAADQVTAAVPENVDYAATVYAWSPEERKERESKFVRRMDLRLLPILMVMYIMNYIDRNALPHARVQGLEEDLGLSGVQYNIVLSLTFIGYILMQVPSNMLLSLLRPSWYLSACMVAWGLVSGLSGAVQNFGGLAACRFFLGITEAPFFVGCAFLFSGWYTKKELGLRLAIFYTAAMMAGAFGGLFAAGIAAAFEGNRIESWRWLFIIEGAATVVFAVVTGFTIPDWPTTTKWLSHDEKALAVIRLVEDAGSEEEDITTWHATKLAAKDYRVWLCVLGQFCIQAIASLTNFLPTLVQSFGYPTIETLLLTAPPYVLTALVCLYTSWHSDRLSMRSPFILGPACLCVAGIVITIATLNTAARYFALFLMLPGTYGCLQISNAWMANIAARPQKKRAISLALNNSVGNLALVWTPYLYPSSHGPRYVMAWGVNLGLAGILIGSTVVLRICLSRSNKKIMSTEDSETVAAAERDPDAKESAQHIDEHLARVEAGPGLKPRYQL